MLAINKLEKNPFKIISLSQIKDVHKTLFNEIYDWAGKYRTINIFKSEPILDGLSVNYSTYDMIEKDINSLDSKFKKEPWNTMGKSEKLKKIIYYFSSLWKIHPFREGNTRSIATLLILFSVQIGFIIDVKLLREHAKFFRNSLVMASIDEYSELNHIQNILGDALNFKKVKENKYQTINGYKVEKYKYQPHQIKE